MLTAVAGAVGSQLRSLGEDTDGLLLRALVPLADADSPRLLASHVALPFGTRTPAAATRISAGRWTGFEAPAMPVPVRELVEAGGFAPPTILGQAVRLQTGERGFDLVVTNVPGPKGTIGSSATSCASSGRRCRWRATSRCPSRSSATPGGCISVCSDPDALGDPARLADLLERATAELRKGGGSKRAIRERDAGTADGRA